MAENEKAIPLAVSLPETLIADIDRVAADVKDSRSGVMRRAIREGLPIVTLGGKADAIVLDSELSAEIDQAANQTGLPRRKIILESTRTGLPAYEAMKMSEKVSQATAKDPKERELIIRGIEESFKLYHDPMVREHRIAVAQRGTAALRLDDILEHVPEAKRRYELMNRLAEIRNGPDGGGSGMPLGLSTAELEWQIGMSGKHGPQPASWPADEKEAHRAAEDAKKAQPADSTKRRK